MISMLFMWNRAMGGLVVIDEPATGSSLPDSMSETELESLLHFAIRHSDPSKLYEMATREKSTSRISPEEAAEVMKAIYSSESLFFEHVQQTIVARNWTSEEQPMASLDFIEDYGDHLLDKGDLLHGVGALEKLIHWMLESSEIATVRKRVADLVVSITQNRESTKNLIHQFEPKFVLKIFTLMKEQYVCDDSSDEVCASLVSTITAVLGGNEVLMNEMDEPVIVPLGKLLTSIRPSSKTFSRILTLLKVVQITNPDSSWIITIDREKLVSIVGTSDTSLKTGEKILDLLPPTDKDAMRRLYSQCLESRRDPDSCSRFNIDSRDEL